MNLKELHTVYFLGVGGIGMSAIARYFKSSGCNVVGYDKTKTILTEKLEAEGVLIHYNEDINQIPTVVKNSEEGTLVIYTPAIPKGNKEFIFFQKQGIKLYKRSEVLGLISENYFTIAVAGTHGKTTTSSIVAHILNECGVNCISFLGGISLNFNSNLLLSKNPTTLVVEADEFDRSFLTLSPDIALVTSIDADHLDVYGDKDAMKNAYSEFVGKIKEGGELISKQDCIEELVIREDIKVSSYSGSEDAMTAAKNVEIREGDYYVDIATESSLVKDVKIGLPGIHNVENAIGAFAIADKLELDHKQVKAALGSYKGVYRRFETHIKSRGLVYIDDYAHHPSELEVCIKSARELYPNKKITGIFQPHLFTRTLDFIDEFAESLSLLDELILLDIYPARELPLEGVDSELIKSKVTIENKSVVAKADLLNTISEKNIEVLLTMGAGDIDVFVQPIKAQLLKRSIPLKGDKDGCL
ncbi:MAG: UDP-N-acetylmuramate--L-alanine ligase [Flavobacteriales bacterium]|tara:strand:- start:6077 stop:7492 length:1416 start_codon:yes stop_codon:yes gene_type:complete